MGSILSEDIHLGFTGTQEGMTEAQENSVRELISQFGNGTSFIGYEEGKKESISPRFLYGHHGDCIGADADFHRLMRSFGFVLMEGHPPKNPSKRAFCDFDVVHEEKEYLDRNKDIVDSVKERGFLIVCPKEHEEQLRSGTWSTYRYALKQNCNMIVVYPDGSEQIFRLNGRQG